MLTFIKKSVRKFPTPLSKQKKTYGIFICSCNVEIELPIESVKSNRITECFSCQDLKISSKLNICHPDRQDRLWYWMMERCYNPNEFSYAYYGGKGVRVCDEWHNRAIFKQWVLSMPTYTEDAILDKDILSASLGIYPAIYSPNTCLFISKGVSIQEKLDRNRDKGNLTAQIIKSRAGLSRDSEVSITI